MWDMRGRVQVWVLLGMAQGRERQGMGRGKLDILDNLKCILYNMSIMYQQCSITITGYNTGNGL